MDATPESDLQACWDTALTQPTMKLGMQFNKNSYPPKYEKVAYLEHHVDSGRIIHAMEQHPRVSQ